jgi:recombination DNA repair RAD52 pathway protein
MRKIGKTLIAVFIAAELGFVLYIVSPLSDRSSGKSPAAADSSVKAAAADTLPDAGQVAAGAIAGSTTTGSATTGRIVAVPNVMADESKPVAVTPPVVQPVIAAAPRAQPAAQQAKESTTVRKPALAKTDAVPSSPSVSSQAPRNQASDDARYRGDNAVASAMTEALVKQSAQLDPSLPPPTNMPARSSFSEQSSPTRGGANAVSAAMTAELVRQSSKIDASAPAPNQTGTR